LGGFVVAALLPPLWKREIQKAVKEGADRAAHERRGKEKEAAAAVALPLHDLVQEFKAYQEKQDREGQEKATRERVTIAALILTVIFTFLTVVVFKGQLDEMRATGIQTDTLIEANRNLANAATQQASAAAISAQTAQDTLLASQRAWVGPTTAKIEGAIEAGKEVKAVVTVVNTGREPGKNLFWDVVGIPTDNIEDTNGIPAFIIRKYIEACFNTPSQYRRQVIFPSTGLGGGGFTFTTPIGADKIDDGIVSGTKTLLVQGCLAYDAFGKTHHTAFCYFYNALASKPAVLNICTGGTDAD